MMVPNRTDYMRNVKAPQGCRQYFTSNEGFIQSFNFGNDGKTHYYSPQDYT